VALQHCQAAARGGVPYARGLVKGGSDDAGAVGLNAAELTLFVSPWSTAKLRPEAASHTRAVASEEAVTMRVPSGLNTAELTVRVWPWSTARLRPELASHTRAVLSEEAVTMRVPSGLNAAE